MSCHTLAQMYVCACACYWLWWLMLCPPGHTEQGSPDRTEHLAEKTHYSDEIVLHFFPNRSKPYLWIILSVFLTLLPETYLIFSVWLEHINLCYTQKPQLVSFLIKDSLRVGENELCAYYFCFMDGMITKRREKKIHCQSFYSKIRLAWNVKVQLLSF